MSSKIKENSDYNNCVFYDADGYNQVRRYYTIKSEKDFENIGEKLADLSITIAPCCFAGIDFLKSLGVYIVNKEAVPYEINFPKNSDIDALEKFMLDLGKEHDVFIKPIVANVDIRVLMEKEANGELSLNNMGEKSEVITEDIMKPRSAGNVVLFMKSTLSKLNAKGKDIIIVDNYLFPNKPGTQYEKDLVEILLSLEAKSITCYGIEKEFNSELFESIDKRLNHGKRKKTELKHINAEEFHDRFWINVDTLDGVVLGTSLNGIGRKMFYYNDLEKADVKSVLDEISGRR